MTAIPSLTSGQLVLVTGPARSGKSAWAETLAAATDQPVTYVATAAVDPTDTEWQARIVAHRRRRPATWRTLEGPIDLAAALLQFPAETCVLIDSLGTWLANLMDQDAPQWTQTTHTLLQSLENSTATIIIVAEETGWGVVPAYASGRQFRDRLGTLTRDMAQRADLTYLVTAGFALNLKEIGISIPEI